MSKMSLNDRARQFLPFDALKGLKEALLIKDYEHERLKRKDLSDEKVNEISNVLISLEKNDKVKALYFSSGAYNEISGVAKLKIEENIIMIDNKKIYLDDLYEIFIIKN